MPNPILTMVNIENVAKFYFQIKFRWTRFLRAAKKNCPTIRFQNANGLIWPENGWHTCNNAVVHVKHIFHAFVWTNHHVFGAVIMRELNLLRMPIYAEIQHFGIRLYSWEDVLGWNIWTLWNFEIKQISLKKNSTPDSRDLSRSSCKQYASNLKCQTEYNRYVSVWVYVSGAMNTNRCVLSLGSRQWNACIFRLTVYNVPLMEIPTNINI